MTPSRPLSPRIDKIRARAPMYWRFGQVDHRLGLDEEPAPIPCVGAFSAESVLPCGITVAAAGLALGAGVSAAAGGGAVTAAFVEVAEAAVVVVVAELDDAVVADSARLEATLAVSFRAGWDDAAGWGDGARWDDTARWDGCVRGVSTAGVLAGGVAGETAWAAAEVAAVAEDRAGVFDLVLTGGVLVALMNRTAPTATAIRAADAIGSARRGQRKPPPRAARGKPPPWAARGEPPPRAACGKPPPRAARGFGGSGRARVAGAAAGGWGATRRGGGGTTGTGSHRSGSGGAGRGLLRRSITGELSAGRPGSVGGCRSVVRDQIA